MGLFQSIFTAGPQGHKLRKQKFRMMRAQAWDQIHRAIEAADYNERNTERARAGLNQKLFARGLGKSSIAEQDKEFFEKNAANRAAALARQVDLAYKHRRYILQAIKYERKSTYAQLIDGVVSVFGGIGQGGSTVQGNFAGGGGGGEGGGSSFDSYGDYDMGGYS